MNGQKRHDLTPRECIDTRHVDGETVEYEIIFGNEKIVFIKAGAGGSARGHEDKYLKMARRVHERIGATVICASNPDAPHENLDEAEIRKVISERGLVERGGFVYWLLRRGVPKSLTCKTVPRDGKMDRHKCVLYRCA